MNQEVILEKIAKLTHEEWEEWSKTLVIEKKISDKKKIKEWKSLWVEYSKLPEKEKKKDRKWAKKFYEIIKEDEKKPIRRSVENDKILVLDNGKEKLISQKYLLKKLNVDGIIRIQKKDFPLLFRRKYLTHFNLEWSGHVEGKRYILAKIERPGYFKKGEKEVQPLLSFDSKFVAKCIGSKEFVKYDEVTEEDFKYSFENIKSIDELKEQILYRYTKSLPDMKKKELLDLGVGITYLQFISGNVVDGKTFVFEDRGFGSTRSGFGKAMVELGKKNKDVIALCADLKDSLKLGDFEKKHPERFYEFGIAEQNMMSAASGMTKLGKIPFVASYAAFNPGRNWDQLRVSVCYSNANVKVLGGHAGLTTGPDGATHQALEDIAITRVLPNLKVVVPCDEEETRKATIALANDFGPAYLRVSREKCRNITDSKSRFEIGKANVLADGVDVAIVACGIAVQFALEAKEELDKLGISCVVINMHTIKPLDEKTLIKYAKKVKAFVTVEEHQKIGGLGSAVCEYLSTTYPIKVEVIAVEDKFGSSGEGYELLEKYGISKKEILNRIKKLNL